MDNTSSSSNQHPLPFSAPERPASRVVAHLAALAALLLAAWIAARQYALPVAQPETAAAAEFSASRAMKHLPAFATVPRPAGSAGHAQTRDYLMAEICSIGLEPQLQETTSVLRFPGAPGFSAGAVKNVIARLPGTAPTGAIALDAHYDGAATGPAAGDCGSGVITLLETMRALTAGPPLKNDVIFVFADAEEVGDLGAHAFAGQHPWMEDVRLALNYEAMGTRGPAYLYVTHAGNRQLIAEYARTAPGAISNSFVVGLFNLFPEQRLACDLQDYLDEGSAGCGFVFSGNSPAYHTRLDNIESLSPRTVQQLGDKTMGLLHHFGNANLAELKSDTDAVFFTLWPGFILYYPASWALPLALLAAALLLALAARGVRNGKMETGKIVQATLVFLLGALLAAGLTVAIWFALKSFNPNLQDFQIGNRATGWYLAGLLLLAAAFMAFLQLSFRRRLSFVHQAMGAVLGFAVLALLLGAVYPAGSYLFLWPALVGAPALAGILGREKNPWNAVASALAVSMLAIVLIAPVMAGPNPFLALLVRLDAMSGMPLLGAAGLFSALLAGLLLPVLRAAGIRIGAYPAALAASLALIAFAAGWIGSGYSAKYPQPGGIRYELDANTSSAQWVTSDTRLGAWTKQFIPPEKARPAGEGSTLLFYWPVTFTAPAPALPLAEPKVAVVEDFTGEGRRRMRLHLHPGAPSSVMQVRVHAEAPLRMASVEGQELSLDDYPPAKEGQLTFNYAACPPEGVELLLLMEGTGPLKATVVNMSDGLPERPGEALPQRPEHTMPALLGADAAVVRKVFSLPEAPPL